MSVCAFNFLPKGGYSKLFIVAAFSSKSFSGKTSLPVENSYLLTFPDDKAAILAVCLNHIELGFTQFCLSIVLIFSLILIF